MSLQAAQRKHCDQAHPYQRNLKSTNGVIHLLLLAFVPEASIGDLLYVVYPAVTAISRFHKLAVVVVSTAACGCT